MAADDTERCERAFWGNCTLPIPPAEKGSEKMELAGILFEKGKGNGRKVAESTREKE